MTLRRSLWPLLFLTALLVLALTATGCVSYAGEMEKALKRIYRNKQQFRGYAFRGTPVGSFGVGTMYLNDIKNPNIPVEERWLIGHPDSWFADNVSKPEREAILGKIFLRGALGDVNVTEDISRKLGIDLSIPVLRELLALGAGLNLEKGVTVALKASEAVNRRMNWTEFEIALRDGKIKPEIKDHVERRNFIIVANDIQLKAYRAVVTVDSKINPELDAKLHEAVGKVLGKDTHLKISITSSHRGTYEVEAANPVVAAVLYKEPPPVATLADTDIDAWPTARVEVKRMAELESLSLRK